MVAKKAFCANCTLFENKTEGSNISSVQKEAAYQKENSTDSKVASSC